MLVDRPNYMKWLWELKDQNLIKVLTGARRVGKSTLLQMHAEKIMSLGVPGERVLSLNFEDPDVLALGDWKEVYDYVKNQLDSDHMNYIFLDEIQNIANFERLLDGLFIKKNVDLYVTGSNAHLLSSELATILTGRSIEKNILPLDFAEYLQLHKVSENLSDLETFRNFIYYGSIPEATTLANINVQNSEYFLRGVLESVIEKDIFPRKRYYNHAEFDSVTDFVFDSIGSTVSPNSIAESLSRNKINIDDKTIRKYLQDLTDSYLFYKASRFDVKGKRLLQTLNKYYCVDPGFRYARLSKPFNTDMGHLLENAVFIELLRRYPKVSIGKVGKNEVDFVATDVGGKLNYFQVAYSVMRKETLTRELKPLSNIRDSFPKFLITTDIGTTVMSNGIVQLNAKDWFLRKEQER